MKMLISVLIVAVCSVLVAQETTNATVTAGGRKMTEEERAARRAAIQRSLGGKIERPGSQKGSIVFINTTDVSETQITTVANVFANDLLLPVTCIKVAADAPQKLKENAKANIAIVLISSDTEPPMLVAPEEGWAVVNVKKLDKGLPNNALKQAMWNTRIRKELIRAFSIVCGGYGSPFKGSVINSATVEDLDVGEEVVPYDTLQLYPKYLKSFGITPKEVTWYRTACKQGWAPSPTNDVQQAIWDKYHELPTNGMKIEFDPKKGE